MNRRYEWLPALILSGLLAIGAARDAEAQLKGHYIPGFTGIGNGTQAPPSINVIAPVYFYTTDDIRNDDGESIDVDARINVTFLGAGVAWVTNAKILGANWGGSVVPISFIKSRIEGNSLDVPGSLEFTDITIQPLQLGWHTTRADFVTGYSLFLPTGKWELGGGDNTGLGMWSHDFQAGTTLHLDNEHRWSFSTLGTFEIHSHKEDTDIKVGDILTVEGGLGRTFINVKMMGETPVPTLITNVGLAYYGQFKVSNDEASVLTPLLEGRKDYVFGVGLEGNVIIPDPGLVFGLRVVPEFGAHNRTQGWTFMLTLAYELKSLVRLPEQ
jgi:hypothetical protein